MYDEIIDRMCPICLLLLLLLLPLYLRYSIEFRHELQIKPMCFVHLHGSNGIINNWEKRHTDIDMTKLHTSSTLLK